MGLHLESLALGARGSPSSSVSARTFWIFLEELPIAHVSLTEACAPLRGRGGGEVGLSETAVVWLGGDAAASAGGSAGLAFTQPPQQSLGRRLQPSCKEDTSGRRSAPKCAAPRDRSGWRVAAAATHSRAGPGGGGGQRPDTLGGRRGPRCGHSGKLRGLFFLKHSPPAALPERRPPLPEAAGR